MGSLDGHGKGKKAAFLCDSEEKSGFEKKRGTKSEERKKNEDLYLVQWPKEREGKSKALERGRVRQDKKRKEKKETPRKSIHGEKVSVRRRGGRGLKAVLR